MTEEIRVVEHYLASIFNKVGERARVLGALRKAGVNRFALRRDMPCSKVSKSFRSGSFHRLKTHTQTWSPAREAFNESNRQSMTRPTQTAYICLSSGPVRSAVVLRFRPCAK
jgi:hypothetical protein